MFLHDFTRIEYSIIPIIEVVKFIALIDMYWSYFSNLVSNLSYEVERVTLDESDRIVGNIDFIKTNKCPYESTNKKVGNLHDQ